MAGHGAEEAERAPARERHRDRLPLPRTEQPGALLLHDEEVVHGVAAVAHHEPHGRARGDAPPREREREVACVDRDRQRARLCGRGCAGEGHQAEGRRGDDEEPSHEPSGASHVREASPPGIGWTSLAYRLLRKRSTSACERSRTRS